MEIDGHAIHEHVLDPDLRARREATRSSCAPLRSTQRAIRSSRIGVTAGFNPGERGRLPGTIRRRRRWSRSPPADVRGAFKVNMPSGSVRKRGPGQVVTGTEPEDEGRSADARGAVRRRHLAATCDRLRAAFCSAMSRAARSGEAAEGHRLRQAQGAPRARSIGATRFVTTSDGWLAPALAMLLLVSEKAAASTLKTST